ncbi:MAG TPA: hypothetical protein PKH69_01655 [Thiobacillaceae bacterium]|nr:hypothetical protein [Thiobacillaceae bacterium]HNU64719.1 hypothetical protein [Thiobacillaceae bacterium]
MTAIQYMHHTPGRLRIKGAHFKCRGEQVCKAVAALQAMQGVERVQLNSHAGSLIVHYDPKLHTQDDLLDTLGKAGCLHLDSSTRHARVVAPRDGVTQQFGRALVGALAQRTATKLIGALL